MKLKSKRLLLEYDIHVRYRVHVPDTSDEIAVTRAIEEAVGKAGLTNGRIGIVPESIRFSWEETD